MIKVKKNGFVLAETLIVSVFVMVMFTIFSTNVMPLVGEYERREDYNDIDSVYASHFVRKLVLSDYDNIVSKYNDTAGYVNLSCNIFTDVNKCNLVKENFDIKRMFLIRYETNVFKSKAESIFKERDDRGLLEYISYLPKYENEGKSSFYRVVIERCDREYLYYGTVEVKR